MPKAGRSNLPNMHVSAHSYATSQGSKPLFAWSIHYVYMYGANLQTLGGNGAALTIFIPLTEAIF